MPKTIYFVPKDCPQLELGELIVTGTLLERLANAQLDDSHDIVLLPLTDREVRFVVSSTEYLEVTGQILTQIPGADYSIAFLAQESAVGAKSFNQIKDEAIVVERAQNPRDAKRPKDERAAKREFLAKPQVDRKIESDLDQPEDME